MLYFLVNTINMTTKRNPSYLHILQNSVHFMTNISFFVLLPLVIMKYVLHYFLLNTNCAGQRVVGWNPVSKYAACFP